MDDSVDPPEFDESVINAVTEKSEVDVAEKAASGRPTTPSSSTANRCFLLAALLGIVLIALLVTAAVLLLFNRPVDRRLKDKTEADEIYSELEVNTAHSMSQMMDQSVEPCDNFYRYACGGWMDSVSSSSQTQTSVSAQEYTKSLIKLKELMGKPVVEGDPAFKRKTREFFAACNNTDKRKLQGITPFLNLVKSVGTFPFLTSSWTEQDFNLQDMLTKLAKLNVQPLFEVIINTDADLKNPQFMIIQPTFLSDWKPRSDGPNPAYVSWTEDALLHLGVDIEGEHYLRDKEDAFDVESLVYDALSKRRDPSSNLWPAYGDDTSKAPVYVYHQDSTTQDPDFVLDESITDYLTIGQLEAYVPALDWHEYLYDISYGAYGINKTITSSTVIFVPSSYEIIPSLRKVFASSKRALANCMMKSLLPFTNYLYPPTRDFKGYFLPLPKYTEETRDFQACHLFTLGYFDYQISRILFDEILNKSHIPFIHEMMGDIKDSIRSGLGNTTWLNPFFKKQFISKITAAEDTEIPPILTSDDILNKMHESIPTGDFFEFFPALARYRFNRAMNRARNESGSVNFAIPDPSNPFMFKEGLKAYSQRIDLQKKSSIIFATAGINRGGPIVSYLLDSIKKAMAKNSNLIAFSRCLDTFFPEYILQSPLSKADLKDQNSVLFRKTFEAYKAYNKRHGDERPLPDLGLNNDQLFLLSYTQSFCEWLPSNSNAPSLQQSVLGTLMNSAEFADTFQCKQTSAMNPEIKCRIF